jgi:YVTN family beta-propeller protein
LYAHTHYQLWAVAAEAARPARKQATMKLTHRPLLMVPASIAAVAAITGLAPAALAASAGGGFPAVSGPHVTATIPVGKQPGQVAVNPRTDKIYVTNFQGGSVSVINGRTHKVTATITGFSNPNAVAVNPRTDRVYVTDSTSTVFVISGRTSKVSATIPVADAGAVTVNPGTDRIYVAGGSGKAIIAVINGQTDKVVAGVTEGNAFVVPYALTADPHNNRIYVAEGNQGAAAVVSGRTNKVIATIDLGETFPTDGVAVDPGLGQAYVSAEDYTVDLINTRTSENTGSLPAGNGAGGVAVDPQTHLVYVANPYGNTVSVDNGSTGQAVATVPVGNTPVAVAADPSTHVVYAVNQAGDTVSVIAP